MAQVTANIRGQVVTAKTIGGFTKQANNLNQVITVWANYAAVCAVFHNGLDALNNMLKCDAFRLSSGKPSALGKQVVDYVTAHAGQFVRFDSTNNAFTFAEFKGKDKQEKKRAARGFVDPSAVDGVGAPVVKFTAQLEADGSIPSKVDFALSFDEFREFVKPKKATEETAGVRVETIGKQMEKAIKAISEGVTGSVADFAKALENLDTLQKALTAAAAVALAKEESARADIVTTFLPSSPRADDGVTLKNEAA